MEMNQKLNTYRTFYDYLNSGLIIPDLADLIQKWN